MCTITNLLTTADEAIAILADLVDHTQNEPVMWTSALVCLADAETCFEQGNFAAAVNRAHKGISYLKGMVVV